MHKTAYKLISRLLKQSEKNCNFFEALVELRLHTKSFRFCHHGI